MASISTKLAQIVAIARLGSISKAAEELHLSQPALSRSIAALERNYGVKIFDRSRRGVIPTASGRQIVADAEALLRRIRTFEHNSRMHGRGETGRLAIGFGPLAAAILMPGATVTFMRMRPAVSIEISIRPPGALLEQLLRDEIELFLFAGGQIETPEAVETRELGRVRVRMLVRGGHPLAGRATIELSELEAYPLASGTGLDAERLFLMPASVSCDNYHLLREVALGSDAVWLSSPAMCADDIDSGRLVVLEVVDLAPMWSGITLFISKGRVLSPLAQHVVDLCVRQLE